MPSVTRPVTLNLGCPVSSVRFDAARSVYTFRASMPETAVNEHTNFSAGKNKVGLAGKASSVKPVP